MPNRVPRQVVLDDVDEQRREQLRTVSASPVACR